MDILQMSLSASAIILFAMLLRLLTLNRLPKRTFVALWLLASARMLFPWKLSFRFSANALIARTAEPAIRAAVPAVSVAAQQRFEPIAVAVATAQTAKIPIWRIVWLAGLVGCLLALTLPHLRWRRVYARSLPASDANIADWLREQKLIRRVRVRTSDEIHSPLTCGLLRPMILLPANLDPSGTHGLKYVLEHELTHIRHFDALWKLLLAAALCAHWFNPLAWGMYLLANRDIELACDEAVLRRLDNPARRDYARTLLDLAARQSGLPSPLFSGFSRQTIEERIRAIVKMKKLTKIAALAAVLLIAFSALAFATTPQTAERVGKYYNELSELMFEGYEEMSVGEYRNWLLERHADYDTLSQDDRAWEDNLMVDFMLFVLDPLTDSDWDAQSGYVWMEGFGQARMDPSQETAKADMRITCTVLNDDQLTVKQFRDSLKAVVEGMEDSDLLENTQEQLEARAMDFAEAWSDGQNIAFQIEIELEGSESSYTDLSTVALLREYAKFGLEYDYRLGDLIMRFEGREVNGIWDETRGIIVTNSTGPKGLEGGSILEVIYKDGEPSELRFTEE